MTSPSINHWAVVEQVLCYLKALGQGILYNNHDNTKVECSLDVD